MSTTYTRDFDADFNFLLNESELSTVINATVGITPTLISVVKSKTSNDVDITFDSALSASEEYLLNYIVHNHIPSDIKRRRRVQRTDVMIQHENTKTQSSAYKMIGKEFTTTDVQGAINYDSFVVEYPINILTGFLESSTENIGDKFSIDINPDTVIGAIGANASIGDRTFIVSPSVLQSIKTGRLINLFDGVNTSVDMEVVSINMINSTVTVSSFGPALDIDFSAITPTYVRMTIRMVENYPIKATGIRTVGNATSDGTYMDVGTVVRIGYTNNGTVAKSVDYAFECKY